MIKQVILFEIMVADGAKPLGIARFLFEYNLQGCREDFREYPGKERSGASLKYIYIFRTASLR